MTLKQALDAAKADGHKQVRTAAGTSWLGQWEQCWQEREANRGWWEYDPERPAIRLIGEVMTSVFPLL